MHEVVESISNSSLPAARKNEVKQLANNRWNMLYSPMHAAGFVLNPEFQTYDQHANEEVMEGFWQMVNKLAPAESHGKIAQQRSKYKNREGLFSIPAAINAASTMAAHALWLEFGASCPELQSIAVKVLAWNALLLVRASAIGALLISFIASDATSSQQRGLRISFLYLVILGC
jgi:hypothetical protein